MRDKNTGNRAITSVALRLHLRSCAHLGITDEEPAQRHKDGESLRSLSWNYNLSPTASCARVQPRL